MGYYIEVPDSLDKARQIMDLHGAKEVSLTEACGAIEDPNVGVIVVIDNQGLFEAAAYAFSENELNAFIQPDDLRPKRYLTLPKEKAEKLSGYDGKGKDRR